MNWPAWWDWELEISSHCFKRMQERRFHETDLRAMLEDAESLVEQVHGAFVVSTRHAGEAWEVIVSPDLVARKIVVVTAYPAP
jgi:hypothetical protein